MADSLSSAIDAYDDPVVVVDSDGKLRDWNDTVDGMLSGTSIATLVQDGDGQRVEAALREAVESGHAQVEATIVSGDGDGERYGFEFDRIDGDAGGVLAVGRKLANRTRREEVLATLNRVASEMQDEGSVESVCERTAETASDLLDFEMCSVVIREGDWLVPYAISEGAPPDGSRRMRVDQGLAGKTYQTGESEIIDRVEPDDGTDPAKDSYRSGLSVPIGEYGVFQAVETEPGAFDESDVELAELLVTHAATAIERIERERDLEQQNEQLERFASVVSHDLRNPLNAATTRLELAREECDSDHLEDVVRAHDRMAELIDDILALARANETVTDRQPVALADATRQCWGTVETGDAKLLVETDQVITADESKFRQLLANLVRNAVEHAASDVTVTVGELDGGFYVEDDGPGIPVEKRESVFEFGYSSTEDGTGFGLNIVASVAEAHGWEVTLTEGTAGGARFEFTGVESV